MESKNLLPGWLNLHAFDTSFSDGPNFDLCRRLEESRLRILRVSIYLLKLFNCQLQGLGRSIVILTHTKYRVAHAIEPFIKEPIHRLTGCLFDGDPKLLCFDRLVCIFSQI